MPSSAVFRIKYHRSGWSAGRFKHSEVFVSARRALSQANKLVHATQTYGLSPIDSLEIEEGVVMWSREKFIIPDELRAKIAAQPEQSEDDADAAERERVAAYARRLLNREDAS